MRELPLRWVVANWRLKLVASVLAACLLTAVAFSENPPEVASVAVKVEYVLPAGGSLAVIGAPSVISVPVVGLRDAVAQYEASASGVVVDLSRSHPGVAQTVYAHPRIATQGVTPQSAAIPITLTIERLQTVQLAVQIRTPKLSPGIAVGDSLAVCGNEDVPCQVTVTAPASLLSGLAAYVAYDAVINGPGSLRSPNQPVLFERHGQQLDLGAQDSLPRASWTPSAVTVKLDALGGSQIKTVPLTYQLTGTPACGYTVSGVEVAPGLTATVSGPSDQVAHLNQLALAPAINLAGQSGSQTVVRQVATGQSQVSVVEPAAVKITVSLAKTYSCAGPAPANPGPASASG